MRTVLEELSPTQEKVDRAVQMAIEIVHPSRVILFGSWPRGEAQWDSDLDMAVLVSNERRMEIGELRHKLSRALSKIPMSIDLILASEIYAAEFFDSINSVYYRILHQGEVVYDNRSGTTGSGSATQS